MSRGVATVVSVRWVVPIGTAPASTETAEAMASALSHCPDLTELSVRKFFATTKDAAAVITQLRHCSHLTALDASYNKLAAAGSLAVATMMSHCTELRELTLNGTHMTMTEELREAFAKTGPKLRRLSLQEFTEEYDEKNNKGSLGVGDLVQHCPNLSLLNLRRCNLRSIPEAIKHFTNLTFVDFSYEYDISMSELIEALKHCHSLTHLCLKGMGNSIDNEELFSSLLAPFPQLTFLDIGGPWDETAPLSAALSNNCPDITTLGLHQTYFPVDILQFFPGLTNLDIRYFLSSEPDDLLTIAKHCPNLTRLDVRYHFTLTPTVVVEVINRLPQLTEFWMCSTDIGDITGMYVVLRHLPQERHHVLKVKDGYYPKAKYLFGYDIRDEDDDPEAVLETHF